MKEEKIMSKRDKYNSSGCLDMTAYLALRNVEREERRTQALASKRGKGHPAQKKENRP